MKQKNWQEIKSMSSVELNAKLVENVDELSGATQVAQDNK